MARKALGPDKRTAFVAFALAFLIFGSEVKAQMSGAYGLEGLEDLSTAPGILPGANWFPEKFGLDIDGSYQGSGAPDSSTQLVPDDSEIGSLPGIGSELYWRKLEEFLNEYSTIPKNSPPSPPKIPIEEPEKPVPLVVLRNITCENGKMLPIYCQFLPDQGGCQCD